MTDDYSALEAAEAQAEATWEQINQAMLDGLAVSDHECPPTITEEEL